MSNDDTRKEIGFLLTDIERFEQTLGLRKVAIINDPDDPIQIEPDTEASEALEIIERIERFFSTYTPLDETFAAACRKADREQRRKPVDPKIARARRLMADKVSYESAYAEMLKDRK